MTVFEAYVLRGIRKLGLDLRRYRPATSTDAQLITMLNTHNVNLIFDVGANEGQFATQIRVAGYAGRIVSFEPLSIPGQKLLIASNKDPLWVIAPQAACGNEDGEIEIHIAGNSVSSSILEMLETHSKAAPNSSYIGSEKVALRRLDTLAPDYLFLGAVPFIKIDTQGFEDRVLQGAPDLLAKAAGLQLELSLIPLYHGQRLYQEMIIQLNALGFDLWSITPAFIDQNSGRLLQIDATFFRSPSGARTPLEDLHKVNDRHN